MKIIQLKHSIKKNYFIKSKNRHKKDKNTNKVEKNPLNFLPKTLPNNQNK
jgi:hypothetical protein